jgi:hypothetical protein
MNNTDLAKQRALLWTPVAAATGAALWMVPAFPLAHLDDPSHWGVLGYVGTLGLLLHRARTDRPGIPKRLPAYFLVGMPLIYLANWIRFGGSAGWLVVELGGLVLFGVVAWLGRFRGLWWLPVGIAGHGVWDAWHLGLTPFIPDWYATACAIVDVGLGGYVAGLCLMRRD